MKRMWMSNFKREVGKYINGTIVVKLETSFSHSGFEMEIVQIIIHNEYINQPFIHNIGSIANVMSFNPIEVAGSFVRYYREIIFNKFFKCIDKN